MNRFRLRFPALLALACALLAPAFAEDAVSVSAADDETPSSWFIELAGSPLAEGGKKADLKKGRDAFAAAAKAAGAQYTKRFEFETLWNGVSVSVSRKDLSRIARLPEVVNVWPVDVYSLPEPGGENSIELFTAITTTGANVVQEAGITGAGIKIGIIDTGVDFDHPDFGGSGVNGTTSFPSAKVVAGYDFVGDAFNSDSTSATYNPVPTPDPIPDDCNGHGSHVAGIAAANGFVKGVAPDAVIGAYRVFGCDGSTSADIMVAAMERALNDGMDVVNMSIGSSFQWPQYPTAVAADRLVARGVVVACSIGNSGANGQFAASAPGVGKDVIGTASFVNTGVTVPTFTVSPDDTPVGYNTATGAPLPPTSGTFPMARTGTATSASDACTALPAGSLTGKIALIRRGTCSFYIKVSNAQAAGAVGVVLYNNVAGWVSPTVSGTPAITIPVVATSDTAGVMLDSRLASGPVDLTWTADLGSFANPAGGVVDTSSSWGFAADLSIKPDIGAPGGSIFSTYPLEKGGYTTISGTSMASPHVAGTAALLLQANPGLAASAVRGILQNSAVPRPWLGTPSGPYVELVHRQGAGMVRIDRAVAATTTISPGKLSLGETEFAPVTETLTFKNNGADAVTYDLSHDAALASGPNNNTLSYYDEPSSVSFSAPSVLVPASGSATVDVTVDASPGLPNNSYFGGYVVATPQGGGEALRVPFGGTKGDYQTLQVLVPTANGFPWLAQLNAAGTSYLNRNATGATYTLVGADIPYILMHLEHQSRRIRIEVTDAVSGKSWHRVSDDEYLPRNSSATGYYAFTWDGTTFAGKGKNAKQWYTVPDGQYILTVSVLKALGEESNPAHWEVWTSSIVTIDRP